MSPLIRVGMLLGLALGVGWMAVESRPEHLFTRFFRSSLAQRSAIQGSGLGLSLARAVAEEHGGTLRVDSVPGEGATFSVRIPLDHARNMQDSTKVATGDT